MIIEEALYSYLSGYAGLSARIGTRLYPLRLPENVTYDAATYQRISGPRVHSHSGASGLAAPRFQLDCYSETYLGAKNTAAQVRIALDGYKGTMGGAGGVSVQSCLVQDDRDFYDADLRVYRVSLDVVIEHAE